MTIGAGVRLGTYEVVGPLGAGGMGEVYRARDSNLKREVAIKVLPESFSHDQERVARLRREAEVLASLNHPRIAAIYDLIEVGTMPFLILELVEGDTLADGITRGPLTCQDALAIASQIAEALDAAHDRGIIHRDLKPANIKITPDGHVKVLDFGLAKMHAGGVGDLPQVDISTRMVTSPGVILGTIAYMSPEQANGAEASRTSDMWAFGCVLYEMLAGSRAFEGATPPASSRYTICRRTRAGIKQRSTRAGHRYTIAAPNVTSRGCATRSLQDYRINQIIGCRPFADAKDSHANDGQIG